MTKNTFLAVAALLASTFAACSEDPITTIDRNSDCSNICNTYKDCIGGDNYSVSGCTNDCKDMVSHNETDQIDDCSACIDDKGSCIDSAFGCATECAGIVP
jgi:hypothetical protein